MSDHTLDSRSMQIPGSCRSFQGVVGFTLVELLIVIAMISLLIGILLPAIGSSKELAKKVVCLSNMRVLSSAWLLYAETNKGRIVLSDTLPGCWVSDLYVITDNGIKFGTLYPYVGNVKAYRCLSDYSYHRRTYSINAYLADPVWFGKSVVYQLDKVSNLAGTIVFAEENDPCATNRGSWVLPVSGNTWVDNVAAWHFNGGNLGFADTHAEYRQWSDPRTLKVTHWDITPGNEDLINLQMLVKSW